MEKLDGFKQKLFEEMSEVRGEIVLKAEKVHEELGFVIHALNSKHAESSWASE